MKHSQFIYITGCDGTGKTTQARLLLKQLKAKGVKVRHLWLRYPFFLSIPLLFYARLRGYSWREVQGGVRQSYWDFQSSWVMCRVFPWVLLVDAALAALWKVFMPMWRGEIIVCERFVLDMLVDLNIACGNNDLHRNLPGSLFLGLIPKSARVIILDLTAETARERRTDLLWDRRLEDRFLAYRILSKDLHLSIISSLLPAREVSTLIYAQI